MPKNKIQIIVLSGLVIISFAFFAIAQENTSSSHNIFLDSDQDGLSDEEERSYGTDPYKKDTDGDGYSDGAEIKSGYDPLKPAPNDKIFKEPEVQAIEIPDLSQEKNLTKKLAYQIAELTNQTGENGEIDLQDVQDIVNETLNTQEEEISLPEINKDEIKIKEQDYDDLDEDERKEKMKEDFLEYTASMYYILVSNSPDPVTSSSDLNNVLNSTFSTINNAILTRDSSSLNKIQDSAEKMSEQIKDVEVPEDLLEAHVKALSFAMLAQEFESYINTDTQDPIKDISNLSKLQGLVTNMIDFASEIQEKLKDYDIEYYDEEFNEKIESMGLEAPGDFIINISQ